MDQVWECLKLGTIKSQKLNTWFLPCKKSFAFCDKASKHQNTPGTIFSPYQFFVRFRGAAFM
jgi:hypothetical protein